MHIEPNPAWYWSYSEERRRILIHLVVGDQNLAFMTAYGLNDLFSSDVTSMPHTAFTVDDSSFYFYVIQAIGDLPYTPMEKVQLALNAVTVKRFYHKGLKSVDNLMKFDLLKRMPQLCEVFSVKDINGSEPGDVIVINPYEKTSVCLVLATGLNSCGDSYNFLDVAVVNNENFIPLYKMNLLLQEQVGL
ncbi:MAG: cell division protein ZapC [Succinivibrionaceae bacterium]|nr:cell division protein ZapC [Succinivibrionaceae bacterium]